VCFGEECQSEDTKLHAGEKEKAVADLIRVGRLKKAG
jgi:hypothetical protein